jgi:adenylate kinase family enzyme
MNKILIIGGPRTGKSTLASERSEAEGLPIHHLDDLSDRGWSEQSDQIAEELSHDGPWIKEGVSGVRGLRKWLQRNPGKVPDFEIIHLTEPRAEQSVGQAAMQKGHNKIWGEVEREIGYRKRKK